LLDVTFDSIYLGGVTNLLSTSQGYTLFIDKFLDILQSDFFVKLELESELPRRKLQNLNLDGQNFLVH
jgi:hypothetical protein